MLIVFMWALCNVYVSLCVRLPICDVEMCLSGQDLVMLHRYLTPAGGLRFEWMVIALSLPRMSVLLRRFKFKFISLAVLQSCNLTL